MAAVLTENAIMDKGGRQAEALPEHIVEQSFTKGAGQHVTSFLLRGQGNGPGLLPQA
jgi:hypothetical protein